MRFVHMRGSGVSGAHRIAYSVNEVYGCSGGRNAGSRAGFDHLMGFSHNGTGMICRFFADLSVFGGIDCAMDICFACLRYRVDITAVFIKLFSGFEANGVYSLRL